MNDSPSENIIVSAVWAPDLTMKRHEGIVGFFVSELETKIVHHQPIFIHESVVCFPPQLPVTGAEGGERS